MPRSSPNPPTLCFQKCASLAASLSTSADSHLGLTDQQGRRRQRRYRSTPLVSRQSRRSQRTLRRHRSSHGTFSSPRPSHRNLWWYVDHDDGVRRGTVPHLRRGHQGAPSAGGSQDCGLRTAFAHLATERGLEVRRLCARNSTGRRLSRVCIEYYGASRRNALALLRECRTDPASRTLCRLLCLQPFHQLTGSRARISRGGCEGAQSQASDAGREGAQSKFGKREQLCRQRPFFPVGKQVQVKRSRMRSRIWENRIATRAPRKNLRCVERASLSTTSDLPLAGSSILSACSSSESGPNQGRKEP